jgi:hypothetical protein
MFKILNELSANGKASAEVGAHQGLYRSRLKQKASALLHRQAQGKYLNNQQKRIIRRWQRIQLLASVEVAA